MSNFLPDGFKADNQLVAGSSTEQAAAKPKVTDADKELAKRIFRPELVPDAFMAYLTDYIAVNQLPIPLSMIQGYPLTAPFHAEVSTSEVTSSTSYTDLSTAGPTITKGTASTSTALGTTSLPDGIYLVMFGFSGFCNNKNHKAYMSISVNGAAASDADSCYTEGDGSSHGVSVSRAVVKTLTGGVQTNSIAAKFRTTAGNSTFESRWIIAQRLTTA